MYLSGYLQRDVSIGNVLMTEQPAKRKAFEIPKEFLAHLSSLGDGPLVTKILGLCKRVEELVAELGISDECIGFMTDGDLAISWKDCFSEEHRNTKSVGRSQVIPKATFDATPGYTRIRVPEADIRGKKRERLPLFACGRFGILLLGCALERTLQHGS